MVKDSPESLPIMPAMRAAVERQWPDTQRAAASLLGDEALAAEIMEDAIEQAVAYLTSHPPEDHEDVGTVLSRLCREEVGRRRRQRAQFAFSDFSFAPEIPSHSSTADAAIDAERILQAAPPKVREAMMMRYGSSESWSDVAARIGTEPAAVRMSCKRFLDRIRRELGIEIAPQ
jgi:DNA-directed RNA polymerase specialized sigma24 family protein